MAHYAYKEFCYDLDYETFLTYCKKYKELYDEEPTDANYDGEYWVVAAMWMYDVLEENKKLKEELANLTK